MYELYRRLVKTTVASRRLSLSVLSLSVFSALCILLFKYVQPIGLSHFPVANVISDVRRNAVTRIAKEPKVDTLMTLIANSPNDKEQEECPSVGDKHV